VKGEKTVQEATERRTRKNASPDPAPGELDEGWESGQLPEEHSAVGEDPTRRTEGETEAKCVKCGKSAFMPEDEADPLSLLTRLIREFVTSPQKELCSYCLLALYPNLGFWLRDFWKEWLSRTDLGNTLSGSDEQE
jgi:hypothetical protein